MKNNPAIKYGLIGAAALVVIGIVMQMIVLALLKKAVANPENFSIGRSILISVGSLILIVAIFIICIVRSQKDLRHLNPDYTYRQLVGQGLITTLVLVLVSMAISYLYGYLIAPELKGQTEQLTIRLYENMDMPEEQKEKMIAGIKENNPLRQVLTSLGLGLLLGMIISLISSMILNKRNTIPNHMR